MINLEKFQCYADLTKIFFALLVGSKLSVELHSHFRNDAIKQILNTVRAPLYAAACIRFYPISKDHLYTVTFGRMYGLYSRAASNQERPKMVRVRYLIWTQKDGKMALNFKPNFSNYNCKFRLPKFEIFYYF